MQTKIINTDASFSIAVSNAQSNNGDAGYTIAAMTPKGTVIVSIYCDNEDNFYTITRLLTTNSDELEE